jgi:hypothetical protein
MPCLSAIPLQTTTITPVTIGLTWGAVSTAANYQVEYKQNNPSVVSWTLLPSQTTTSATIGSLIPSTEYLIRVRTVCQDDTSCYSVTILATTL